MTSTELIETYNIVKAHILSGPYKDEVAAVDRRTLDQVSVVDFFYEYVYVVLNTGMKNQVAQRMYEAFRNSKASDPSITVGHEGKRKAIVEFTAHYRELYEQFKAAEDKIAFLGTLPFIGEVNKFHLARNLGLDVAKPDRHMVRLTKQFNFPSAQAMCEAIRAATGDRIGTIDVILWRACNLGWL